MSSGRRAPRPAKPSAVHDLFVTVRYPPGAGRILLRTGLDWDRDVEPVAVSEDGYEPGSELLYLAFPLALHDELHWAMRCHLPFQFFFGSPAIRPPGAAAGEPG